MLNSFSFPILIIGIVLSLAGTTVQGLLLHYESQDSSNRLLRCLCGCARLWESCLWLLFFALALNRLTFESGTAIILRCTVLLVTLTSLLLSFKEHDPVQLLPGLWALLTVPFFEIAFGTTVFSILLLILLTAELVEGCIRLREGFRGTHTVLTEVSVQDGLDTLSHGILFAEEDGTVLLTNQVMDALCSSLCREHLTNANRFWEKLSTIPSTSIVTRVQSGDSFLFRFGGGNVWSLYRREIEADGVLCVQIIALNITESDVIRRKTITANTEAERICAQAEAARQTAAAAAEAAEKASRAQEAYSRAAQLLTAFSLQLEKESVPELLDPKGLEAAAEKLSAGYGAVKA